MEPEISHRCSSCGASYRAGAEFCPQCGGALAEPMTDEPVTPGVSAVTAQVKGSKRRSKSRHRSSKSKTSPLPFTAMPAIENRVSPPEMPATPSENQTQTSSDSGLHVTAPQLVSHADVSHSKRQRVKDAAREMVEENVRPRVEKLRHASSVVLEEAAAIDPSLRFVLIALFLFVVFIVLLLFSFIR